MSPIELDGLLSQPLDRVHVRERQQRTRKHFRGDPKVPDTKVALDLESMIERTRPRARQRSMTFTPISTGGNSG
jgi:hypothetical protein